MVPGSDSLNELFRKIEALQQKQVALGVEIGHLRQQLLDLKPTGPELEPLVSVSPLPASERPSSPPPVVPPPILTPQPLPPPKPARGKTALETFLGENLISKIGIAILVIGVAIGAKYSIEHDLISPLTRIILGYFTGMGLFGVGVKLKAKYEAYSAVLVSGAIAILYFITYAAYSFYGLLPQALTFALLVLFTVFIVVAALRYNRQVVALIGLVGAYAVPFLLSEGKGQVAVLFTYMVIINTGILLLAFKRAWKLLYYTAFALSWLIYGSWFAFQYEASGQAGLAFVFLLLFFSQFYAMLLAYKTLRGEPLQVVDVALLLLNAFLFYGLGYALLDSTANGTQYLGLFTLGNAVLHFGIAWTLHRRQAVDRRLFYLVAALVLTFVTIAAPVQLSGHWVTLLWTAEAAALFWIGRTRRVAVFEWLAYPLMVLAFGSLLQDWSLFYDWSLLDAGMAFRPVLNSGFLTSALFLVAFGSIYRVSQKHPDSPALETHPQVLKLVQKALPGVLLLVAYMSFRLEISAYWDAQAFVQTTPSGSGDGASYEYKQGIFAFKQVWLTIYTLLFAVALAWGNLKKFRDALLGKVALALLVIGILGFLTTGLMALSELRDLYLSPDVAAAEKPSGFVLVLRYVAYGFVAAALWTAYQYTRWQLPEKPYQIGFDALLHLTLLWAASSELVHWLALGGSSENYKLGLSILWGLYALILVGLGIRNGKQYLRFGGMGLFGVTLLKLFFYDIAYLNTIAKTIVFVSLGVLLLVVSFLYNKYKGSITNEKESS